MKQRNVLLIAAAAAALYFMTRRRGYSVSVPAPDVMTSGEFERSMRRADEELRERRRQDIIEAAKKAAAFVKTAIQQRRETQPSRPQRQQTRQIRRQNRKVGQFKDFC